MRYGDLYRVFEFNENSIKKIDKTISNMNLPMEKSLLNDRDLYKFDGSAKIYQGSKAHKIWMCYNLETFFSSIE